VNKTVLVVGGAGYVGSHTCMHLKLAGYEPVVYDNLSNGHFDFVKWGPYEYGDIRDKARLQEVLNYYKPASILHFAAFIEVGQSIKEPVSFYDNNVAGSLQLFAAAIEAGVRNVVFSSTCATYGVPRQVPIDESHPQHPINPYGRTKLIVEQVLGDYSTFCGLKHVALRYFNAAGADMEGRIGEWHDPETHVIPLAIEAALGKRKRFMIYGDDYPTRDGTCVRDYIHVNDLAVAHVKALNYLESGGYSQAINLGTGTGTTVRELLDTVKTVSGRDFEVCVVDKRDGDSPVLVADNEKASRILGWKPQHDLRSIVQTAWNWHLSRS
jgi:UDP-glucose 4-epimerase